MFRFRLRHGKAYYKLDITEFFSLFLSCLQGFVPVRYETETWWLCDRGRWPMMSTLLSTSRWNTRYDASATHSSTLKPLFVCLSVCFSARSSYIHRFACWWLQLRSPEWGLFSFLWLQKYPPQAKYVRAVSIMTGYYIKSTGPNSCTFTYLSQADPKGKATINSTRIKILLNLEEKTRRWMFFASGSIPKVVVNNATRFLAPKVRTSYFCNLWFFFCVREAQHNMSEHTHTISEGVCPQGKCVIGILTLVHTLERLPMCTWGNQGFTAHQGQ